MTSILYGKVHCFQCFSQGQKNIQRVGMNIIEMYNAYVLQIRRKNSEIVRVNNKGKLMCHVFNIVFIRVFSLYWF